MRIGAVLPAPLKRPLNIPISLHHSWGSPWQHEHKETALRGVEGVSQIGEAMVCIRLVLDDVGLRTLFQILQMTVRGCSLFSRPNRMPSYSCHHALRTSHSPAPLPLLSSHVHEGQNQMSCLVSFGDVLEVLFLLVRTALII